MPAVPPMAAAPPLAPPTARTAIVVVHGMGQQMPFQTLDAVVAGLRPEKTAGGAGPPVVRLARLGDVDLAQVELSLRRGPNDAARAGDAGGDGDADADADAAAEANGSSDGEPPVPVHLYECYWAPLTEGQVTLRDVVRFLWSAGWNGLRNSWCERGTFRRWMFGRWVCFPLAPWTAWVMLLALLVLAALAALNAVTAVVAARLLADGTLRQSPDAALRGLTWLVGGTLVAALLCIAAARLTKHMAFVHATLLVVALGGLAAPVLLAWPAAAAELAVAPPWPPPAVLEILLVVLWLVLLFASARVRGLLVQYVGDVAAYVQAHTLDRFAELRAAIKREVRRTLDAVYQARDDNGGFLYEHIVVVGHSLGSVAAYDALNGLINAERLEANDLRVVPRTALLLTFGSPLDKTAFIFKAQGRDTGETREALAAAVQPLIQDYALRTFRWVNVYARRDVVSGELNYYDDPKSSHFAARGVHNVEDQGCDVPLLAHVQYWQNATIFRVLREAVLARR